MENDRIAQRILDDAKEAADKTLAAAREKAEKFKNDAASEAEKIAADEQARTKVDCEKIIERRATVARLDGKKEELSVKQKLVSRVYEVALDDLCAMPKERYIAFIEKQVGKYAEDGDGILIASGAPVKADDLAVLKIFKEKRLTPTEGGAFRGGIRIIGKTADIDLSFSALVSAVANGGDAARELFGDDN